MRLEINTKACVRLDEQAGVSTTQIASPDMSIAYPYCQNLAQKALKEKTQALRTPSARRAGHHCVPIFDDAIVQKDSGILRYVKCTLFKKDVRVMPDDLVFTFSSEENKKRVAHAAV